MEFANEGVRSRYYRNYCDFETIIDLPGILATATGTAAASTIIAPATQSQIGVLSSNPGTDVGGLAGWLTSALLTRLDNGGTWKGEWSIRTPALSDGTNTYSLRVGFLDSVSVESTDGVFFRYTHSVNSGKWQFVTRANSVETITDTGITYATATNYKLQIQVQSDGLKAFARIDDVNVASATATIPVGAGRETGFGAMILKTAGATTPTLLTDYSDVVCVFK